MPYTRNPLNIRDIPENRGFEAGFDLLAGRIASDNVAPGGIAFGTNLTQASIVMTSGTSSVAHTTVIAGNSAGNVGGIYVTGRFATTNAGTITVTHGLGRSPIGYLEVRRDGAGQVFSITSASTITTGPPVGTTTVSSNWGSSKAAFSCAAAMTANMAWLFF